MQTLLGITPLTLALADPVAAQHNHAADEAALRDAVKQMETGWNTHSGAAFAKPFAEDADYVVINGRYIQSRAVIEKAHQQLFDTIYKDTTIRLTVRDIRFLRTGVAVVHVDGICAGPCIEKTGAMITLAIAMEEDRWMSAAFEYSCVSASLLLASVSAFAIEG